MADTPTAPESGNRRSAVDAGRTGDKVPVSDPAAAPMEADTEASGMPTSRSAADADMREQEQIARDAGVGGAPMSAGNDPSAKRLSNSMPTLVGIGVVVLAVIVAVLLML